MKALYKLLTGSLVLAIFFVFSATILATDPLHAQNEKVVIAHFGKEKFLLYLPLYIAMEEGFFARRGLDVDLRFVGNDDQVFATVISGDASFGIGDPVFAAISREKGGPGKVVAMMVNKLGLSGYTKNPSLRFIEKPADAAGLKFSSLPAPSTTYTLLSEFVRNNDLSKTGTKIVQASVGAHMATLEAGLVDIAIDLEPAVSVAESKGYRVNFSLDKFTDEQAITGITTLDSVISSRPEMVQKLVSGLQEAIIILHNDREVSLRVARKLFPNLEEVVTNRAVDRMLNLGVYPKSVKIGESYWQRSLKTRLDSGDLKKPQSTDVAVDNKFADKAISEVNNR